MAMQKSVNYNTFIHYPWTMEIYEAAPKGHPFEKDKVKGVTLYVDGAPYSKMGYAHAVQMPWAAILLDETINGKKITWKITNESTIMPKALQIYYMKKQPALHEYSNANPLNVGDNIRRARAENANSKANMVTVSISDSENLSGRLKISTIASPLADLSKKTNQSEMKPVTMAPRQPTGGTKIDSHAMRPLVDPRAPTTAVKPSTPKETAKPMTSTRRIDSATSVPAKPAQHLKTLPTAGKPAPLPRKNKRYKYDAGTTYIWNATANEKVDNPFVNPADMPGVKVTQFMCDQDGSRYQIGTTGDKANWRAVTSHKPSHPMYHFIVTGGEVEIPLALKEFYEAQLGYVFEEIFTPEYDYFWKPNELYIWTKELQQQLPHGPFGNNLMMNEITVCYDKGNVQATSSHNMTKWVVPNDVTLSFYVTTPDLQLNKQYEELLLNELGYSSEVFIAVQTN